MTKTIYSTLAALSLCSLANAFVIDFESANLPADSFDTGPIASGETTETENPFGQNGLLITTTGTFDFLGGVGFSNVFNLYENPPGTESTTYWNGFALSNVVDTTTPGIPNQYAVITGGGFERGNGVVEGSNYSVVYNPSQGSAVIDIPEELGGLQGIMITNTTYAYLSMVNGDSFAKQFEQGDWFQLNIIALDDEDNVAGSTNIFLADFRSSNPEDHYILDEWSYVRLDGFGDATTQLQFQLYSSDTGEFGMNTPAYFAVDDLLLTATAFAGADPLTDDWNASAWFGQYYDAELPWVYHETLEWIYLDPTSIPSDVEFWTELWGWVSTSAEAYPWVYQFDTGEWLYYFEGSAEPWVYYDSGTNEVVEVD